MRIIAAFSGVGKSYYCKQNPKAIDFVVMPCKYSNFCEVAAVEEGESIKAHENLLLRENWENVYFNALMEAYHREPDKVFVIPSVDYVLRELEAQGIPFLLVYPHRSLKELYRQRYIDRGNTQEFLDVFIGAWDYWMDSLRRHGGTHLELLEDVYLSDILPEEFPILKAEDYSEEKCNGKERCKLVSGEGRPQAGGGVLCRWAQTAG